ncbi:MAG: [Fe-S]-binding protein, partial [Proteobacteria bacterium]|nr:[Fe-S]-binding protein [Pseudomonadota bacterium]
MTENNNNKSLIKTVSLTPPSLQDNTADAERLIMAMQSHLKTNAVDIDLYLLRELPVLLRKWNYNV